MTVYLCHVEPISASISRESRPVRITNIENNGRRNHRVRIALFPFP